MYIYSSSLVRMYEVIGVITMRTTIRGGKSNYQAQQAFLASFKLSTSLIPIPIDPNPQPADKVYRK